MKTTAIELINSILNNQAVQVCTTLPFFLFVSYKSFLLKKNADLQQTIINDLNNVGTDLLVNRLQREDYELFKM
jgi:hypothetical protein